jgi:DNA-binding NtrC family response regulator
MSYEWPGNVRELENVIERAVVTTNESWIRPEQILLGHDAENLSDRLDIATISGRSFSEIERVAILHTLESVEGSPAKAADILGISLRKIQYRLRQYREAGSLQLD